MVPVTDRLHTSLGRDEWAPDPLCALPSHGHRSRNIIDSKNLVSQEAVGQRQYWPRRRCAMNHLLGIHELKSSGFINHEGGLRWQEEQIHLKL